MTEAKLRYYVMFLPQGRRYRDAAKILWPWIVQNEWTEKIYNHLHTHPLVAIMGHGSASKTFTASSYALMKWWTDPSNTAVIVTSDTVPSMRRRVWSDIKMLHENARVRMPGRIIDSKCIIQCNLNDEKNCIHGVAAESDNAQSKIQGLHTKKIFCMFDEADNHYSRSIWSAMSNLETSGQFQAVALANPVDKYSDFGQHCEPLNGWTSIDPEHDFEWKSVKGWNVLRLDGARSPNIVAGEDKYPFLLTNASYNKMQENKQFSPREWWTYARAWYPEDGLSNSIFTSEIISRLKTPIEWYSSVTPIASCDPAFEGGDNCLVALGRLGRKAEDQTKLGVECSSFVKIKRLNPKIPITIDYGDQIVSILKKAQVKPENFIIDSTGSGIGLSDYIKFKYGMEVVATNFGGSPTNMRITQEDSKTAEERFDRFVSELWFSAREWSKLNCVYALNPPRDLLVDLESRLYEPIAKNRIKIESKSDMKGRGLRSPDHGDTFCLLIHLARMRSKGFIPTLSETPNKRYDPLSKFKRNQTILEPDYNKEAIF